MTMPGKNSIGFRIFEKLTFLRFFENFNFSIENLFNDIPMPLAWPVSSTSLSGGNQVDGLPPASSNTGAALASWHPKKC